MEFKRVEAEKNRQHELQIAQIFASAMHNQGFQRAPYSTNTNVYQPTVHQGKNTGRIPQQILATPPPRVEQPNEQMSPVYPARSETIFSKHFLPDSVDWPL